MASKKQTADPSKARSNNAIEDLEVPKADDVRGGATGKTLLSGPYDDRLNGVYTTSYEQEDDPPKR